MKLEKEVGLGGEGGGFVALGFIMRFAFGARGVGVGYQVVDGELLV